MSTPVTETAASFVTVAKLIPLALRLKNRVHFKRLFEHFGIDESLLKDQRTRKSIGQSADQWSLKRQHLPRYWIEIRGSGAKIPASIVEASEYMRLGANSIRQRVTSSKSYSKVMDLKENGKFTGITDTVTLSRMSEQELEEQERLFMENKSELQLMEYNQPRRRSARSPDREPATGGPQQIARSVGTP